MERILKRVSVTNLAEEINMKVQAIRIEGLSPEKEKEEWVNRVDREIMKWFYEVIRINFDAEMVQDSTELRAILKAAYEKIP